MESANGLLWRRSRPAGNSSPARRSRGRKASGLTGFKSGMNQWVPVEILAGSPAMTLSGNAGWRPAVLQRTAMAARTIRVLPCPDRCARIALVASRAAYSMHLDASSLPRFLDEPSRRRRSHAISSSKRGMTTGMLVAIPRRRGLLEAPARTKPRWPARPETCDRGSTFPTALDQNPGAVPSTLALFRGQRDGSVCTLILDQIRHAFEECDRCRDGNTP
jgi:hypothetical protein